MSSKRMTWHYSPRILPDVESIQGDNDEDEVKTSKKYMRRFIQSIIRCEEETFNTLLPMIDINGGGSNKWTPILWAVQKERISYIRRMFDTNQLVDFSKHIDNKTTKRTTLHFAAEKGDIELVTLLLDKNKSQETDINHNSCNLDINAQDREKCTALFRAAKIGENSIIKVLLQNGAYPNICNREGTTPLIIASLRGHKAAVEQLLSDPRTNINLRNLRGQTALMCSCAEDRIEIAQMLLQFKEIDLNATDKENYLWNCLMWCVYRKNEKMLALLLEDDKTNDHHIDYFHEDYYGQNILDMLRKKKLTKKLENTLRNKFHSILFPQVAQSEIITELKIPFVVVSMLLVFTY